MARGRGRREGGSARGLALACDRVSGPDARGARSLLVVHRVGLVACGLGLSYVWLRLRPCVAVGSGGRLLGRGLLVLSRGLLVRGLLGLGVRVLRGRLRLSIRVLCGRLLLSIRVLRRLVLRVWVLCRLMLRLGIRVVGCRLLSVRVLGSSRRLLGVGSVWS